ncbi:MAG: TIGR02391 family protein [Bacilli bacterium]|nr:TIGR02391 family protein [Bacilli bacterium]
MKEILKESIKTHYENKDYTEVVRDALLCLTTEIRKKSDLTDSDGVDLINKAFSEKQPLIKINKLETTTDKNKHRGIMDLSKGLIEYFRNPMSHSKQEYSKKVADAILVLLDEVILEEIIGSKSINSIEDWYLEITNDLFPNTERYAKSLISAIPKNKYYELAVMLYKNRNNITKLKDKIIDELVNNLSEEEFKDYCEVIENDLFGNITENDVISSLKFISTNIWNKLSDLAKSKVEDVAKEDISNLYLDFEYECGNYIPSEQKNGYILENSIHILENFSNLQDIIDVIVEKATVNSNEFLQDYLFEKYFFLIMSKSTKKHFDLIDMICDRLRYKNKPMWYEIVKKSLKQLPKDNYWYTSLSEIFGLEMKKVDPFENFDIDKISTEDLPF